MSTSTKSRSGGSGSSSSKAQDEANLKTLRDLSHLQANRHCFECGQRGPTYVDVTIGSFICMTCSGLLRGITPPHRVKSISMATFTQDEVQLLKSRGNEYCRKVWLATHTSRDSNVVFGSGNDEDRRNSLKAQMSSKYEQKRWYVDPSKIPELGEISAQNVKALTEVQNQSCSSSLNRSPSLSSTSSASAGQSPVMNNLRNSQTLPDIKPLTYLISNPPNFINNLQQDNDKKIINTNPLKPDPWGNMNGNGGPTGGSEMTGFNANFANFDEAFNAKNENNNGSFDPFGSPVKRIVNNDSSSSAVAAPFVATFDKPLLPANSNNNNNLMINGGSHPPPNNVGIGGGEDRYAALKDLDELFKTGGTETTGSGGGAGGMTSSVSMPANLSGGGSGVHNGWGQGGVPNPFSTVGETSPPISSGGFGTGASTGFGTSPSTQAQWGGNPYNPFASNVLPSWSTSNTPSTTFPSSGASPFTPSTGSVPVFNPFATITAPTTFNPKNPFI